MGQQMVDESNSQMEYKSDTESMSSGSNGDMLKHDLNTSLKEVYLSPIKLHGGASHSKVTLGKRKLQQFRETMKDQEGTLQRQVAKIIDVMPEDLTQSENNPRQNYKEMKEKADDLDRLVTFIKEKIVISNRRQKIQVLTIAPASWSIAKTKTEFNIFAHVRQARREN